MKKYNLVASFVFVSCVFGAKAGIIGTVAEDCVKDTAKVILKECVTMPLINLGKEEIQKRFFPKTTEELAADKIKKETEAIMADAQKINQLKKAGVDQKVIAALTAQLAHKIQASSMAVNVYHNNCKK